MSYICSGCGDGFARGDSLKRHEKRFPSHSTLTISRVFKDYSIPRSPITDALCDADLVHLPATEPGRLELFGEFVPRISSVENWKSSYSFNEIRRITLGDVLRGKNPMKVWNAEEVANDHDIAASVILGLDAEENPPQAYIMEIPVPSLEDQVAHTRELYDNFTIYNRTPVSANATPKYTLVDVHHDPSYNVATLFGKPKIWLIWPPTKENLRVLGGLYGQGNKFLRCYKQFKGGVFVVQKAGQTLLLPPYNPHTTFSIGGSILCGYEFETIEFFPVTISCLHVEIEYLDNQYPNENDRRREHGSNLENWLDGLEHTLRDGNETTKEKVVEAWIANISTIQRAFRKARSHEDRACAVWEEFLKTTTIGQCPSCPGNSGPFLAHMMSQHVDIIRSQELRAKKRARHV